MLKTRDEIKQLIDKREQNILARNTKRGQGGNIARLEYIKNLLDTVDFNRLNVEFSSNGLIELGHLLENFTKCYLSAKSRKNINSSRTVGGDFTANKTLFEIKSIAINPSTELTAKEQNKPLLVILIDNNRVSGNNFQVSHSFFIVKRGVFHAKDRINKAKLIQAVDDDLAYQFDDRQELNEILQWAEV